MCLSNMSLLHDYYVLIDCLFSVSSYSPKISGGPLFIQHTPYSPSNGTASPQPARSPQATYLHQCKLWPPPGGTSTVNGGGSGMNGSGGYSSGSSPYSTRSAAGGGPGSPYSNFFQA